MSDITLFDSVFPLLLVVALSAALTKRPRIKPLSSSSSCPLPHPLAFTYSFPRLTSPPSSSSFSSLHLLSAFSCFILSSVILYLSQFIVHCSPASHILSFLYFSSNLYPISSHFMQVIAAVFYAKTNSKCWINLQICATVLNIIIGYGETISCCHVHFK